VSESFKKYPNDTLYMVGDCGSIIGVSGKKLKTTVGLYCYVTTTGGGKHKTRYVHTMVLETFVGPRPNGFHASHINGNRHDNRLENLIWESPASNMRRKVGHGTQMFGETHHSSKLSYDEAVTIKFSPISQSRIAELFGISQTEVRRIRNGTTWPMIPQMELILKEKIK